MSGLTIASPAFLVVCGTIDSDQFFIVCKLTSVVIIIIIFIIIIFVIRIYRSGIQGIIVINKLIAVIIEL